LNVRTLEVALRWSSIPLLLMIWEVTSRSGVVNAVLFPPPSLVALAGLEYLRSGLMVQDLMWSLSRVAVGFVVGGVAGSLVGVLTGSSQLVSAALSPIFQMLRPIPPIAFVPIVIVWFGLSETGKWFLVFWGVFFTVWLSAHLGVQRIDETLLRAARCLGTPRRRMLLDVLMPASLPYIFMGLRTAISVSFYTLVAAELAGAFAGIAYRLDVTQQNMQIDRMMFGLILLGLISAITDRIFGWLTQRVVRWNH
tara:strand:- start:933 stop:1688 length:756 start_codon:yes stop_codon:yes gene_type:complete